LIIIQFECFEGFPFTLSKKPSVTFVEMSSTWKLDVFAKISLLAEFSPPKLSHSLILSSGLLLLLCLWDDVKEVITPEGEVVAVAFI